MKKLFLICILFTFILISRIFGQGTIGAITYSPANPTTNDTIRIYVPCTFTSGDCQLSQLWTNKTGNLLSASAVHCVGIAAVICDKTDTVIFPPQPAGYYNFIFVLSEGAAPVPCTPGIAPSDIDSIHLIVSNPIGIPEQMNSNGINIFSHENKVYIHFTKRPDFSKHPEIKLFNRLGQLLKTQPLNENENMVDVNFSDGIYFVRIYNNDQVISCKPVLITNPGDE